MVVVARMVVGRWCVRLEEGDVAREEWVRSPDFGSSLAGAAHHPPHPLLPRRLLQPLMTKFRPLPPPPATGRETALRYHYAALHYCNLIVQEEDILFV
ncbi:hypothetical protein E2C01_017410 [Portunus trituberculatus]|uniref:Uncharacterized protein n=1 Tax=Portunus trituberculatus TaxID=210409 RepID=A0A5B7DSD3_PORTR|nr:hypothetical protein [Portunus trituberculatus]